MTPANAKGRAAIAARIADVVARYPGAVCEIEAEWPAKGCPETMVRVTHGPAYVGILLSRLEASNGYIVPWNSDQRLSGEFGVAVQAEVNRFHRRKCMGWYPDVERLLAGLERALDCLSQGRAFEGDVVS
jgi:hypothetical protein